MKEKQLRNREIRPQRFKVIEMRDSGLMEKGFSCEESVEVTLKRKK